MLSSQTQISNYKFVGRLDHMKTFYAAIKALNFGEFASFLVNEDGFRITAEQGKTVQANVFVTTACFSEYRIDGVVAFGLNMNVFTECLGIYSGMDCSMKMYYKGDGFPLLLILDPHDEDDVTTECSIKTSNCEEHLDYNLDEDSNSMNKVFIRGPDLSHIIQEIDKSADELEIVLSPKAPYFKITTIGVMQSECNVQVAKTSDMFLLFDCRATTTARYKSTHIRMISKALTACSKVAIKTDETGLLEMHFMVQAEDEEQITIQFFIAPLVDMD